MPDSPDRPTDDTLETQMPGDERPLYRDLLARAHDMGLAHIKTKCLSISDAPERRAVFKATVTMLTDYGTADFVGHGDSDESNTHPLIIPHYIRMAETRAIARALRWATNEGRTSMEEMPSFDGSIAVVDFVNQKVRRGDRPATDRNPRYERAELLKAIERGGKMIGQSEKVKSLRERLLKHRLQYNSMTDLAAYREDMRQDYKRLNSACVDADE